MSKRKRNTEQDTARKEARSEIETEERALKKRRGKREGHATQENGLETTIKTDTQDMQEIRQKRKKVKSWSKTEPAGGILLDMAPVFSIDEEYLLLAYNNSIKVFARSTSLLIRILKTGKSNISSFHLSQKSLNHLYVSLRDGRIQLWDWVTGEKLKMWDISSFIDCSSSSTISSSITVDTVFTADSPKVEPGVTVEHRITAHQLQGTLEGSKTAYKTIYRHKEAISSLKVMGNAMFVVATSKKQLIIGVRDNESTTTTTVKELKYTFWSFDLPGEVTCIDTRVSEQAGPKNRTTTHLDLIAGLENASVL
jgi:NET1-associated nuclear protein 1 (U3 small nucleolar RNA-associated protein 17)